MFDVVLELEAVRENERQRRLSVRRRRSGVAPLTLEMDEYERIFAVPDGRSRSRQEAEDAALLVVNDASGEELTTVAIRERMPPPTPSRDTVLRALMALAKAGRVVRDPPLGEAGERRTLRWRSALATQLSLPAAATAAESGYTEIADLAQMPAADVLRQLKAPEWLRRRLSVVPMRSQDELVIEAEQAGQDAELVLDALRAGVEEGSIVELCVLPPGAGYLYRLEDDE
jgi:hypothetical protein